MNKLAIVLMGFLILTGCATSNREVAQCQSHEQNPRWYACESEGANPQGLTVLVPTGYGLTSVVFAEGLYHFYFVNENL